MRAVEFSACSCGGTPVKVEQTEEEAKEYNCSKGCCGLAFECDKCKTRFVFKLEAPEME